jgi:hypothetical protein
MIRRFPLTVSLVVLPFAIGACGSTAADDDTAGSGGTSSSVSGAGGSQAGHSSVGGSGGSGAGGTSAGAGTTGGTGGSAGTSVGGSAGTSPSTGGTSAGHSGSGGSPAAGQGGVGMGGAAGAGVAGASAGASSGGKAGAGGAGGMSGGGAGGMSGGASGGMSSIDAVVGAWDGTLLQFPCGNTHDAYNCSNTNCTNNQTTKTKEWTIGGTSGVVYDVTFNVRGIVETYYYPGATRDGGSIKTNPDLFASGGAPQDSSGSNYDYNTYQLVVTPPVTGAPNIYFLNSVTMAENPHASGSPTTHLTFPINYTKTIKVTGGGKVTFTTFDSNCTFLQNCGPTQGSTCQAPRTVSLDGVSPAAPSTFMQPFEQPTGAWGQWVFFDITKVVEAQ